MTIWCETFGCDREQPATPVERILLVTPMPHGPVLGATAALINGFVGATDHVKRISDLGCCRKHRVKHAAVAVRQIKGRPLDPIPLLGGPRCEPPARHGDSPAGHDIEELAPAHVDDQRWPRLRPVLAKLREQGLVETERSHVADPILMVNELLIDRG